eukprot:7378199-Prymnesium_polylepis.2
MLLKKSKPISSSAAAPAAAAPASSAASSAVAGDASASDAPVTTAGAAASVEASAGSAAAVPEATAGTAASAETSASSAAVVPEAEPAGPVDVMGRQMRRRRVFSYQEKVLARQASNEGQREPDAALGGATAKRAPPGGTSAAAQRRAPAPATTAPAKRPAAASAAAPPAKRQAVAPAPAAAGGKSGKRSKPPPKGDHEVLEEVFGPEVHRYLEKDAAAAPIGKNLYQVDYLRGCDNSGLEPKYLVKWVGWVEPDGDTWEYESSLHPSLVRLYAQCQQSGARFPTYLERLAGKEQSTRLNDGLSLLPPKPEEPALGEDLFRIPVLEMMQM